MHLWYIIYRIYITNMIWSSYFSVIIVAELKTSIFAYLWVGRGLQSRGKITSNWPPADYVRTGGKKLILSIMWGGWDDLRKMFFLENHLPTNVLHMQSTCSHIHIWYFWHVTANLSTILALCPISLKKVWKLILIWQMEV